MANYNIVTDFNSVSECMNKARERMQYYSPYNFYRGGDREKIINYSVFQHYKNAINENLTIYEFTVENKVHYFLLKYLPWDSEFFKIPTYKILNIIFNHNNHLILNKALSVFSENFFKHEKKYCFIEIPTEDIMLLQGVCDIRFKIIETRITYYMKDLEKFDNERYPIRQANQDDIDNLKKVAAEMRNKYDRFHADPIFRNDMGDKFLSKYAEESIKGFADYVIVPNDHLCVPDAFLSANYQKDEWENLGVKFSKMVLSAVSANTRKGWYSKLISEMTYHLRDVGAECIFMHPAATNRAVIHTYEKLGYKYGQASHIFSYYN